MNKNHKPRRKKVTPSVIVNIINTYPFHYFVSLVIVKSRLLILILTNLRENISCNFCIMLGTKVERRQRQLYAKFLNFQEKLDPVHVEPSMSDPANENMVHNRLLFSLRGYKWQV